MTKLPTVDIKGKEYVLVKDRILEFNDKYKQGSITTELVSPIESKLIVIKATVTPEPGRTFTGYSQAVIGDGYINKTSALENAETSAVGRALAMMGIGVIDSVASVDEINKAEGSSKTTYNAPNNPVVEGKITDKQVALIRKLCRERGIKMTPGQDKKLEGLSQQEASQKIEQLLAQGVSNSNDKAKDAAERDIVGDDDIPVIEQE